MWFASRGLLLFVGALLAVLVYSLQLKKECQGSTPTQCARQLWVWMFHQSGTDAITLTTPPPTATKSPEKTTDPAPPPPAGTKIAEKAPDPATPPPAATKTAAPGPQTAPDEAAQKPAERLSTGTREIGPGDTKSTRKGGATAVPLRKLTVVNSGNVELMYFWASECRDQNWGRDRLGEREVIFTGAKRLFEIQDGEGRCCFDLKAEFSDRAQRTKLGVDICAASTWTVAN